MVTAGMLLIPCTAFAQGPDSSAVDAAPAPPSVSTQRPAPVQNYPYDARPFSRMGVSGGVSDLGINMQIATNLNQHLNLRGMGNIFKYSNSFTIDGVPASGNFNLSSAGAMVDYYPFHVGFRVSGGLLFANQNEVRAAADIPGGDTITLNDVDYYSANANPVTGATPLHGAGHLALNTRKPGFMVTTGWGNHVRRNGHWSVPVEVGVAFVGTPKVTAAASGWACTDASQTLCTDIGNPKDPIAMQFQDNLNAQVAKWNKDVEWLKSTPIVSVGIAYSFSIRPQGSR